MNRKEFLSQLEQLLSDVSETERREALEYYENYFEDAGPENEEKIMEELGSPGKVADSIKKDLFGENYNAYNAQNGWEQQKFDRLQKENKIWRNILIAVLVVLTFPLWVGILASVFGICVGILGVLVGLAVAVIACVAAALVAGFALVGIGLVKVFTGFAAVGLILIGLGLILLAAGILGVLLFIWSLGRFIPWFIRGIVNVGKKIVFRKGNRT